MTSSGCMAKTVLVLLLTGALVSCVGSKTMPTATLKPSPTLVDISSEKVVATPLDTPVASASTIVPRTLTPSRPPEATSAPVLPQPILTATSATTDMGEIIYFGSCEPIWRMNGADGQNKELLYEDALCKYRPELSPDRQMLLYRANRRGQEGPISLWVLDIEGKDAWQVSEAPALNTGWLADGKLLYTEYPSYVGEIGVVDPPVWGTDYRTFIYDPVERTRTEIPAIAFAAEYDKYLFSPAEVGKMAAVKDGENNLLYMNIDGTGHKAVLVRDFRPAYVVWSPDGKRLAFGGQGYHEQVYVVDVASLRKQQVTHKDERRAVDVLSWSPDGEWIAFGSGVQLCVVHVQDGEEKCLDVRAPSTAGFPIAWSPDSSTVAVSERMTPQDPASQWDIYTIRVADGDVKRLTHDTDSEHYLLWR